MKLRFQAIFPILALVSGQAQDETSLSFHLQEAKQFLSKGKVQEAIFHYDKAIDLDPLNHVHLYRRATAFLIVGKNEFAIRDFSSCLEVKPDLHTARFQRSKLFLMQGSIDDSIQDLSKYLETHQDEKALELMVEAKSAKEQFQIISRQDCMMDDMREYLYKCPKDVKVLRKSADCNRLLKYQPNQNDVSLQLAKIYGSQGDLDAGVKAIKECLHNDPDQRECKKGIAKLHGMIEQSKWTKAIDSLMTDGFLAKVEKFSTSSLLVKVLGFACEGFSGLKKHSETITYCSRVIDIESTTQARIARGEAYLARDDFENAKRDFKAAHDNDNQNQRAADGYQKAEALLKRAGMKDYYKILGVGRNADQREIKKAFRKMAQVYSYLIQIYHPDKYKGDMSKEATLAKMSDINQANEVLSNEDLRARFDRGDDPNDPNQQQQQHHNPFGHGHGGFQFPQGGFQFKGGGNQFHFNF